MMTAGFGAAAMVSSSSSKRSGFRGTGLSPQAPAEVLPPREPAKVPRRRARPSKPRIPEDLPTEEIVLMPPEVEEEPDAYKRIGEEVTQELDYTQASPINLYFPEDMTIVCHMVTCL